MFWHDEARCRQHDPDLFFAAGARSERRAKAVCDRCPVAAQCLEFAVECRAEFGVWGGLTSRERRRLMRRGGSAVPVPVNA
jgi:WhiB family transcriptional regulator, redox-sensing transcriptional regulator